MTRGEAGGSRIPTRPGLLALLVTVGAQLALLATDGWAGARAPVPAWSASWIWSSARGAEPDHHVYFRRAFTLATAPAVPCSVRVSAATHYVLFVNGRKVGFGPPIADPRRHYFDTREIGPYLRPGPNVVAALVHSLATPTQDFHGGRGLFILQGTVEQPLGPVCLDTDRRWRHLVSRVWRHDAPRQSPQLHTVEIADLRQEPVGWAASAFDDSGWAPALEIGRPPCCGYGEPVPRELGEIDEVLRPVARVAASGEVRRCRLLPPGPAAEALRG
ncbi:MAG: alpha-L-rhamnosidase N-terminal domain-containing protein, partial [Candidatus Riflebacteria bacterium]|nr:alpha-L-rhamnosidase N-terminal domain-containing protein [Candidatus Riflebacteria bacterium]